MDDRLKTAKKIKEIKNREDYLKALDSIGDLTNGPSEETNTPEFKELARLLKLTTKYDKETNPGKKCR